MTRTNLLGNLYSGKGTINTQNKKLKKHFKEEKKIKFEQIKKEIF